MSTTANLILLDPYAKAGRTGYRLKVKDARHRRADVRNNLGTSNEDTPTTAAILRAAVSLSVLLFDATEGDARLMVQLKDGDVGVQLARPAQVLQTFT